MFRTLKYRGFFRLAPLAYLVLALAMTWPLARHFTTHTYGSGSDSYTYLWNYWWARHAIVDLGRSPFLTDAILAPYETSLAMHAYVFLNALLSIPLQYFIGLATINNIFLFLSLTLSAWGAYLLALHLSGDRGAAFVAGIVFAFCPFTLSQIAGGHVNYAMTYPLPWYAYFLMRSSEGARGSRLHAALAGLTIGAALLTEYYFFLFLAIFTALFLAARAAASRGLPRKEFGSVAIAAVASLPLALPVLWVMAAHIVEGRVPPMPAETGVSAHSADLAAFFSPSPVGLMDGLSMASIIGTNAENDVFLGFVPLGLAALALVSRRGPDAGRWFWALVLAVFAVLALGPALKVLGAATGIPLPYALTNEISVLRNMRAPGRFGVMAALAAAMLAARGIAILGERFRWAWLAAALAVVVEFVRLPLAIADCRVSPVFGEIARDTETEGVLNVPFWVRNGSGHLGSPDEHMLVEQTVHGKRIFSGFISRIEEHRVMSYLNLPVISDIIAIQANVPTYNVDLARRALRLSSVVVDLFGIDYIVFHKGETPGKRLTEVRIEDFVAMAVDGEFVYRDAALSVFRTVRRERPVYEVDAGEESSIPALQSGWINAQHDEGGVSYAWATAGKESRMLAHLRTIPYSLSIVLSPPRGADGVSVKVSVNDRSLGEIALDPGWRAYTLDVPAAYLKAGINAVGFLSTAAVRPPEPIRHFPLPGVLSVLAGGPENNEGDSSYLNSEVFDWEQNNSKFQYARVSFALDRLRLTPAPPSR